MMVIKRINSKLINKNKLNNPTEYWLLRHGKTPHNKTDVIATFAGGTVNDSLSRDGIAETEKMAEKIVSKLDLDLVITSRMFRAKQTGEIITRKIKLFKNKCVPLVEIDDLQEVDVGDFVGHTEKKVREIYPKAAESFYSGEIKKWVFPGGEDYKHLTKRVENVINQIKKLSKGKTKVMIIGHGMFNRVINHYLAENREDLWRPRSYPHDQIIIFNLK